MGGLFRKKALPEEKTITSSVTDVQSGLERRRMARIDMILTINCSIPGEIDNFRIMTENVNVLGIKFKSPLELRNGQIIDMQILLKSNFPNLNVKGRVVWCNKITADGKPYYEGGIEFLPYDEEDKKFFQKFIDQRSPHE